MAVAPDDFTVGVEEEFFLVDAETRALRSDADAILAKVREPPGQQVEPELRRSQVETGTAICDDLASVRRAVVGLRRSLADAAEAVGARLIASGTHPFTHWTEAGGLTPKAAYLELEQTYQQLIREHVVSGCHVHVGITDPEAAIQVMNRARVWLPVLVALSANSPYWLGVDTRYASYRTEVFRRWPTAGIPEPFTDRAEYERLVRMMRATDSIDDPARLYWDLRPSARYQTLEFRVADATMTVDECVTLAAITRALVEVAHGEARAEAPLDAPRPELLRAALWRAARYGVDERLIDVSAGCSRPADHVVGSLLAHARPALEERGDWDEVADGVGRILGHGNGATRQRQAYARRGELTDVVDMVAEATRP